LMRLLIHDLTNGEEQPKLQDTGGRSGFNAWKYGIQNRAVVWATNARALGKRGGLNF